jgi:hypothetical protein
MSDNKQNLEAFDLWLASNLKTGRPVKPEFTQTVLRQIEHIKAQQLLNRIIFQERIAKIAIALTVISGLGLLCCFPVLRKIYSLLESGLIGLIKCSIELPHLNLGMFTLVLFVLSLLVKEIWGKIEAEI